MSILQTVIASISKSGGVLLPPYEPVDTGTSLGVNWTVEVISELGPTNFWATFWGNESWDAGLGHIAYFSGPNTLNVGKPNAEDSYTLTHPISDKAHWVFSHADGSGINVYRNGQLLTPSYTGYAQPSSPASNTLLFGARHGNDGTGVTDTIGSGNFWNTNIYTDAKDATWVSAEYENLRGAYGLP